jgi:hypothetical protein
MREQRNHKIQQLEEAIKQFDVTLIQDIDQELLKIIGVIRIDRIIW